MKVKEIQNISAYRESYEKCFSASTYNHYFQRFHVLINTDTLYYRLRWKSRVRYYVVSDGEKPIIIAGFRRHNRNCIIPIGCKEGYDYFDFVYGTDNLALIKNAIATLFEYLRLQGIKTIEFRFLAENSPLYHTILESNHKINNLISVKNTSISLGFPDYATYKSTLSKHVKQNLRTARNRIAKDGKNYVYTFLAGNNTNEIIFNQKCEKYLDLYLERQAEKYQGKSYRHQIYLKHFNYITKSVVNENCIMADISIDDRVVAFLQGGLSSDGRSFEIPRLAIDDKYGFYSPGMILIDETIKKIMNCNLGIDEFNLCRGEEEYKYKMGGSNYDTLNFTVSLKK